MNRRSLVFAGLTLFLGPSLFAASIKKIPIDSPPGPINENFQNINNELANTVHKTSTETIRGNKYFINAVDFSTVTADYGTITTFASTTGTFTSLTASTLTVTSSAAIQATLDMNSHKITNLASGSAATDAVAFSQFKILQVQACTTQTSSSTTSATFTTTNSSCTITPSNSSNKVLVFASGTLTNNSLAATVISASLFRGSTNLMGLAGGAAINGSAAGTSLLAPASMTYLDSPATTSATTYFVKIRSSDGATTANWGTTNLSQVMVLLEVNGL